MLLNGFVERLKFIFVIFSYFLIFFMNCRYIISLAMHTFINNLINFSEYLEIYFIDVLLSTA